MHSYLMNNQRLCHSDSTIVDGYCLRKQYSNILIGIKISGFIMTTIFHLAFPVHDLELAKSFYHHQLGFALGRETQQALILNFGSHQIVAHKVSDCNPPQASIYPRHFGLIFTEEVAFAEFVERVSTNQVPFTVPVKERFKGTRIEHQSFFLTDPSNNLLEFKYYTHSSAIFGETGYGQIGETN